MSHHSDIDISSADTSKKFTLVLDLDETIIHTITTYGEKPIEDYPPDNILLQYSNEPFNTHYAIFCRPGVIEFLNEMSKLFKINVYTNALFIYAEKIVDELHSKLGRVNIIEKIYARNPSTSIYNKSLRHVTDIDIENTIIIDDRLDVWPFHHVHVIKIRPYLNPFVDFGNIDLFLLINVLQNIHSTAVAKNKKLKYLTGHANIYYKKLLDDYFILADSIANSEIMSEVVEKIEEPIIVSESSMYY